MSVRNLSVFQLLYHRNVSELCIWLPNCCCLAAFIDGRLIDTLACLLWIEMVTDHLCFLWTDECRGCFAHRLCLLVHNCPVSWNQELQSECCKYLLRFLSSIIFTVTFLKSYFLSHLRTSLIVSASQLVINMHTINAVLLLGDAALNCLVSCLNSFSFTNHFHFLQDYKFLINLFFPFQRFPMFRIAYFFLWTVTYVIVQWVVHACVKIW